MLKLQQVRFVLFTWSVFSLRMCFLLAFLGSLTKQINIFVNYLGVYGRLIYVQLFAVTFNNNFFFSFMLKLPTLNKIRQNFNT